MTKEQLTAWAVANGWQIIAGHPSLTKPDRTKLKQPKEAIVRMIMKTTVVHLEVKKPAGKWEKMSGASYAEIEADPDTGVPRGLGLVSTNGLTQLMQENRDNLVFAKLGGRAS